MYIVKDKVVLVTGANRGIGKAIVETLITQGVKKIYAAARNIESLNSLVALGPNVVEAIKLDVNQAADIAQVVSKISHLDILINNAGIATGSNFSGETSLKIAAEEMTTNYFGPVNLTHACLPKLRASKAAAIINVSSIAGISNFPALGPYSASKAALHSFTQGLRAELRQASIFVQGVYPGPVDTRLSEGFEMDKATTQEVASAIFNGLEQGVEDVFPDAFSQTMYQIFSNSPKTLEQQFAAMVG
ncbi:MAG: SDR family oxidoreductase [Pseudomonadota bacterium]